MFVENVDSLQKYAAQFAKDLRAPKCVAMHGDLGAGKTEFARAVIRTLCGGDMVVPSPTFTLLQEYEMYDGEKIHHFDLYRIKKIEELEEIGFFDAISHGITLIEWPEIAENFLPADAIHIWLKTEGDGRAIEIK